MSVQSARPQFGGKLNVPSYYEGVNSVIRVLRSVATLRTISLHLNTAGFLTPSGLVWNRERLANYLHNTAV